MDTNALRAVHELVLAGRHDEAAAHAEAALAKGVGHPLLFNVLALARERQGRLAEAERLLRRGVAIAPEEPGVRNALALCLMRQDRPREALAQYDVLVTRHPQLAHVHAGRGAAQLALGAIAAAESSYRRALELDPLQGVALSGLAALSASRGAYADARACSERALKVLPGHPEAVMSLAAADLGERKLADAEDRLRRLLDDPRLDTLQRAHVHGLLGDVLDAKNYPDDAFAAYGACNEALRVEHAKLAQTEGDALAYVKALDEHFARADVRLWQTPPATTSGGSAGSASSGAVGHVFLLGFPRSGTTLLEVILEGHPAVASLEENESLIDAVREFMRRPADLDRLVAAPPPVLEAFRAAYWRHVAAAGGDVGGKVFVDKHPLNTLKLPLIKRLFPNAKIVFACRDPRDVVLSCFRHRFRMSAPMYELLTVEGAARYYDAVMRLALRFSTVLGLEPCLVRHEDVVTGFAREMRRVCEHVGIEWHPAMGDFALRTRYRTTLTPSTAQLTRGLNTEGLGHWYRYRAHLEPVLPLLEPWVRRFFYDSPPA